MHATTDLVVKALKEFADPEQAVNLQRFFKTGPGEYGEGDRFLGIKVPLQRSVAKKYRELPLDEVRRLLPSEYHEHRMTALLILVYKYEKADENLKREIAELYLKHTQHINNWDLVDVTAPGIIGDHLLGQSRDILYQLCRSQSLWERRIAIISTLRFIKEGDFEDTLRIAEGLLSDSHDLIHKAVGWMLREVGKQHEPTLLSFLNRHYRDMPRTMLRYAIERLKEPLRLAYLKGEV